MIYFVQDSENGRIKIGYTGGDDRHRLSNMQVGSSSDLLLIGLHPGTRDDEQRLQRRFRAFRLRGEWFAPCRIILGYLLDHDDCGLIGNAVMLERFFREWELV